jgi:hypothetical protein
MKGMAAPKVMGGQCTLSRRGRSWGIKRDGGVWMTFYAADPESKGQIGKQCLSRAVESRRVTTV